MKKIITRLLAWIARAALGDYATKSYYSNKNSK